ncbi:MAG TPA: thioredoxin family protein [Candidatus Sumerlaeota bacterium]|nr:thioredoxin family protein [Candidatus Sumerlaeota bacterium]HRR31127.1 thioredoxin family protein [Candidatus Sumerlaeia bacterium]HON49011.1 thioredoxin family protein [Candidatus Sumerlaeota bacterium]HOR64381.1 thioredoxin family protein [Candidatus Sumerlaeota bacterium]HPL73400.1 thioredoxin family protein [Candidatus Sumerlaeota bacterium]
MISGRGHNYLIITLLLLAVFPATSFCALTWKTDIRMALDEASQKSRPVLVYFCNTKIELCQQMEKEIFSDSLIQKNMEQYICLRVDVQEDDADKWTKKYSIFQAPTLLIIHSDGQRVGQVGGRKNKEQIMIFFKTNASILRLPYFDSLPVSASTPMPPLPPLVIRSDSAPAPTPAVINIYDFETNRLRNLNAGGDKGSFCRVIIAAGAAKVGKKCLQMDYICKGWGVVMTFTPSFRDKDFCDISGAASLRVWTKAPKGQMFSFKIDEGGTAQSPQNGSDGECWYTRNFTGSGEWVEIVLRLPQDFKQHAALCETKGNKKLDLGAIFGFGVGISEGRGTLYLDDISIVK